MNVFLQQRLRQIDESIAQFEALPDVLRRRLVQAPVVLSHEHFETTMALVEEVVAETVAALTELRRRVTDPSAGRQDLD